MHHCNYLNVLYHHIKKYKNSNQNLYNHFYSILFFPLYRDLYNVEMHFLYLNF